MVCDNDNKNSEGNENNVKKRFRQYANSWNTIRG